MKLALNGALTIGTLDGANIEIMEEVGEDNMFIFGLTAQQAEDLHRQGYRPHDYCEQNHELKVVLDMIASGFFSPGEPKRYQPLIDTLLERGDHYLLLADYADYVQCQERVDALYGDPLQWARRAILNVAGMGKFSSDRTIKEYAEKIWHVKPVSCDNGA
jgi:starch phosphorylase